MTEPVAGPSGPGTVVMDVGGDIGALILYTPAEMDGREIEISRDEPGADREKPGASREKPGAGQAHSQGHTHSQARTHSQVRARHMPGGTRYAAVYPGLVAGPYTIWDDADRRAAGVVITGGEVASCSWPDPA